MAVSSPSRIVAITLEGADPTGVQDSTASFDRAIATAVKIGTPDCRAWIVLAAGDYRHGTMHVPADAWVGIGCIDGVAVHIPV